MTRRILLVDDDRLVLRGMSRVLERSGWEVHAVNRADEALVLLQSRVIHAVIVDYDLGDHTGLDVLEWMQEHLHATVRILMTGHDNLPAIVDAVNRGGAFKVLRKPFHQTDLLEGLEGAMKNVARFAEASVEGTQARRLEEQREIQQLLDNEAIDLALQVIVEAGSPHSIFGYEALMRPRNQRFSTPLALLVAAEEHGRVFDLGDYILRIAAGRVVDLPHEARLFVNLHPSQLSDPARLGRALEALAPNAHRVVLEITERSRLQDIARWEESIQVIVDGGFAIAVDDLGAGYSALSMLADLQPQFIKLDMSLVTGIEGSPSKQRLVQLLGTFGRATGAIVVAEGVETAEQAAVLIDCEIDLLQGYYFGRPSIAELSAP